jgi:hypothetical protein
LTTRFTTTLLPASFGHHVTSAGVRATQWDLIISRLSFSFRQQLCSTINASTLFVTSAHHLLLNDHISILTLAHTSTLSASSYN